MYDYPTELSFDLAGVQMEVETIISYSYKHEGGEKSVEILNVSLYPKKWDERLKSWINDLRAPVFDGSSIIHALPYKERMIIEELILEHHADFGKGKEP